MFFSKAQKAKIIIIGKSSETAVEAMFNPTDYSISKSGVYKDDAGKKMFSRAEENDFTVTLFFDTYEQKTDVKKITNIIYNLPFPTVKKEKSSEPPVCKFVWGEFLYTGYITKVDQKFTMFLSDGTAVRADLTVTFTKKETPVGDKKRIGKGECRQAWTVKSGDRLDLIAKEMLGDHKLWRVIAQANKITDIVRFPSDELIGTELIIPDYYNTMESL